MFTLLHLNLINRRWSSVSILNQRSDSELTSRWIKVLNTLIGDTRPHRIHSLLLRLDPVTINPIPTVVPRYLMNPPFQKV